MKTFTFAALVAAASAQFGTTGHYGNAFAGPRNIPEHPHVDHMYGYDSVPTRKDLKHDGSGTGGDGYLRNTAKLTSVKTKVDEANTKRTNYLKLILERRQQRLKEVYLQNVREIRAPFDYQKKLLEKEADDVIIAMTEATSDVTDAFNDMLERLDQLYDDKVFMLGREATKVNAAIARAVVDQKDLCKTLRALRVDFTDNIVCATNVATTATFYDNNEADTEWRIYEGVFDDFHYDIGHGKGVGEGTVDTAPVVDGFRSGRPGQRAMGDSQTSFGAPVRTEEKPRYGF